MQGYISDSDTSNDVIKDGWLKTGDLGYLETDGKLFVTDRIKDIIICNNQHVSAGELERIASDHPMVDEAVVFGVPDSERCEAIVMAVLLKNKENISAEKLVKELHSTTDNYPVNIKYIIVDSLPRTASGKVDRNRLRQQMMI